MFILATHELPGCREDGDLLHISACQDRAPLDAEARRLNDEAFARAFADWQQWYESEKHQRWAGNVKACEPIRNQFREDFFVMECPDWPTCAPFSFRR